MYAVYAMYAMYAVYAASWMLAVATSAYLAVGVTYGSIKIGAMT